MSDKFKYKLSENQKVEIAENLIDFLENDSKITELSKTFICNWIMTGPEEKRKAFFDVWNIVLKNYLPKTRPILFRVCNRISKNMKIASFTGQIDVARQMSKGKGSLIICDTKNTLQYEEKDYERGNYKHTFFPLVSLLKKAKDNGGCGFYMSFLDKYMGENEYIMRIDLGNMHCVKWIEEK